MSQYTERSSESWFSRLGGAIKGVFIGIIIFVIGFPVLWLNEGRAVRRSRALKEGQGATISIQADQVLPENESKLVHLTGKAETNDILSDPAFGISEVAIRLSRDGEIYQWTEDSETKEVKKLGGGVERITTYSYSKKWVSEPVDSSEFKDPAARDSYRNTGTLLKDQVKQAENVNLGAFTLTTEIINKIGDRKTYNFPEGFKLPEQLGPNARIDGDYVIVTPAAANATPAPTAPPAEPSQATAEAATPAATAPAPTPADVIGATRYKFSIVKPHDISLIAVQKGNTFAAYVASNGNKILELKDGIHTADAMFAAAQASNRTLTWFLRVVGFLCMLIGLSMVFRPLSVLGDIVPFIGNIIGIGTGLLAFLIATPCTLVTIAIAWIVYRPVLGILLLAVAAGSIYLIVKKKKELAAAKATAA
ncbi:MAG: hypothetical protein GX561_06020 [Lentisphaerae bacterium]|jgi:hypothetical protein|nr:hypothetical protein [Lentisphaerota bacterium]